MRKKQDPLLKRIKEVVSKRDKHSEVFLFGSHARGDEKEQSDWDILILLNTAEANFETQNQFIDDLYEVEIETGAVITPLIFTKSEWHGRHSFTPLYENIKRDGLRL